MSEDGTNGGTLRYRVAELEKAMEKLSGRVDRLMFAIVALSLTIAGSAITFALTYRGGK